MFFLAMELTIKIQGLVVRNVDSAIHWIVISLTVVKRLKNYKTTDI